HPSFRRSSFSSSGFIFRLRPSSSFFGRTPPSNVGAALNYKYKCAKNPFPVTEIFSRNSDWLDFLSLNRLQRSTISFPEKRGPETMKIAPGRCELNLIGEVKSLGFLPARLLDLI
ncbi:MAG TPA: hypothetical protein VI479_09605, partial [Blastocatellia bacterium]